MDSKEEFGEKLNFLRKEAEKLGDSSLLSDLGRVLIFSNFADFYIIQVARMMEQIQLKSIVLQGKGEISYLPNSNEFFYNQKIPYRKIFSGIRKYLPLISPDNSKENLLKAEELTKFVKDFMKKSSKFFKSRNKLSHHLCSNNISEREIRLFIKNSKVNFIKLEKSHKELCLSLQPYIFSKKERSLFYPEG